MDPFKVADLLYKLNLSKQSKLSDEELSLLEELHASEYNGVIEDVLKEEEIAIFNSFDTESALNKLIGLHTAPRVRLARWSIAISAAMVLVVLATLSFHTSLMFEKGGSVAIQQGEITVPTMIETGVDNDIVCIMNLVDLSNSAIRKDDRPAGQNGTQNLPAACFQTIIIPKGYTYKVNLPDGSLVTLNAGSEIKFPSVFGKDIREVEFTGEAFFSVVKSDTPFVIRSGETVVTVYGTKFNMFHSKELAITEAVLLEGSIGMADATGEVVIMPNQRVCHIEGSAGLTKQYVDVNDYTAWMNGHFKYNGADLDRIADDISRWYGVRIELSTELKNEKYVLNFNRNASVEYALDLLKKMTNRNIKKEGGTYRIE